jgi:hypothetical protein
MLTCHEIVNDVVAGVPVAVTFCSLCNTAVVFDRRLGGRVLEFGVSGFLRNSDMIMSDRQTESWWQQLVGNAIVGEMVGSWLTVLPARLESFAAFKARAPEGLVLVPGSGNLMWTMAATLTSATTAAPNPKTSTTGRCALIVPARPRAWWAWGKRPGASIWCASVGGSRSAIW